MDKTLNRTMIKLDGKEIAKNIRAEIKAKVEELNDDIVLAIINVGNDEASKIYVKNKIKDCEEIGYKTELIHLDNSTTEEMCEIIEELNEINKITGIMVQLPLPENIDKYKVLNTIRSDKDVDGLTSNSISLLYNNKECLRPCTAEGIIELLKRYNIDIKGKNTVIVGRSNIVGKPTAQLFLNNDATVTICHTKTKNLEEITKLADILVVATGHPNTVNRHMVKDGVILIDVGMNRDSNGKLYGDIEETTKIMSSYYTPVPGGIGPMTRAILMRNVFKAYKLQKI